MHSHICTILYESLKGIKIFFSSLKLRKPYSCISGIRLCTVTVFRKQENGGRNNMSAGRSKTNLIFSIIEQLLKKFKNKATIIFICYV